MDVLASALLSYVHRLGMACDVMGATAHMHRLGYVHRDIKSLNVFVMDTSVTAGRAMVRLGDFGETMTSQEALNQTPKCVGTTQWMAPEIFENWRVACKGEQGSLYMSSADVFSATVVVWECLTTQLPYSDARDAVKGYKLRGVELGDHIVRGLRPSAGAIPDGRGGVVSEHIQEVVECGWQHNKDNRLPAAVIADVLKEAKDTEHGRVELDGNIH